MVTGLKNAISYSEGEVNLEEIWKHLERILSDSIASLTEMREKEGELLYRDFLARLGIIRDYLGDLETRAPQVVMEYKEKLSERISELTDVLEIDESRLSQEIAIMAEKSDITEEIVRFDVLEIDESRLSQEIAIMAEKSDITEEIVRFESHISQFSEMLESDEAIGRKMDFLLQEMLREINTIGSKSSDIEMSRNVIEIKSELAKLREQIQNVE